jgi:hypothetical protein
MNFKEEKRQMLRDYRRLLLDNGFTIVDIEDVPDQFYFWKGDRVGTVWSNYFSGFNFSTVHKPCRGCGTGYGIIENTLDLSVFNANETINSRPTWAGKPEYYSGPEDYVKRQDVLRYTIIYPKTKAHESH